MTVYADILMLVNLYVDFFLLWCVKKFLGFQTRNRRLVLGALAGAVCSLVSLWPQPPALSFLLGLLSALAVTAAAFAPLGLRLFLRAALCFWGFSLGLAGFFLFLIRFFAPGNVAVLGNAVYIGLSPHLLFLFTLGAYLVLTALKKLFPPGPPGERFRALSVENRGASARLWAKADTGNGLREPFSGAPVVVCQAESLGDTAPPEVLEFLRTGRVSQPAGEGAGLRMIPFTSVGGAGVLPAFRPERVTAEKTGEVLNCWIAVCSRRLSAGQFDAIYNPDLFPEISKRQQ